MTVVDQYEALSLKLESVASFAVNDYVETTKSFRQMLKEDINEITGTSAVNSHLEDSNVLNDLNKSVETSQDRVRSLEKELNDLTNKNLKSERKLRLLSDKVNQAKDELEQMKLLVKSCRSLTGIEFQPSSKATAGFIFNNEKDILKPFLYPKGQGANKHTEALWKMLSEVFL